MQRWLTSSVSLVLLLWCFGAAAEPPAFERATPGYKWSFPVDHGSHPRFQTEWWYYTGQLYREGAEPFRDKPAYGFQLTFFRRAAGIEGGGFEQGYLAHAVLTDVNAQSCTFASRRAGGGLGLAGAEKESLRAWAGDWSAELIADTHVLRFDVPWKDRSIVRLLGRPEGTPALQGAAGYSKKGRCAECASMYYSLPAMKLSGNVSAPALEAVHGLGWMDHEFMTNSLDLKQVGWDWLGLMFKDGTRLTVFHLRTADGAVDFASGTLFRDGKHQALSGDDFSLVPKGSWASSRTGATYPIAWELKVPSRGIATIVKARVPACEIGEFDQAQSPMYWEGPVASEDESVIGYLEMTGYAGKVKL